MTKKSCMILISQTVFQLLHLYSTPEQPFAVVLVISSRGRNDELRKRRGERGAFLDNQEQAKQTDPLKLFPVLTLASGSVALNFIQMISLFPLSKRLRD